VSDKVHCREGNSPDSLLRFLKKFYEKRNVKQGVELKGRLRIGHPFKKSSKIINY